MRRYFCYDILSFATFQRRIACSWDPPTRLADHSDPIFPSRYVVSCQVFGKMQKSKKKADLDKAGHIKMLARMYPGLRIAHVDEKDSEFYSVLSKNAGNGTDDMEEEYRIRVMRRPVVGLVWRVVNVFYNTPSQHLGSLVFVV